MAVGDLVVNLVTRTDRFSRGLNAARGQLSSFVSTVGSGIGVLAKLGAAGAAAIGGISLAAIKLAADAEQTAISFEVMTGSVSMAGKLIEDLRTMGAKTPFEFGDLSGAAKTLMAFGRSSGVVLEDLDMLSNVAAGDANKLNSLALVFGQVAANARLTGGDLLQFINTGFNPLQQIAERTGESMSELRDRMSKGKIGFDEVRQAFKDATSEGGRFYQMNEKQSKTLLGRWSTFKDEITSALIKVGQSLMDNMDLTGAIEQVTKMANAFVQDLLPAIGRLLETIPKLTQVLNEGILGKEAGDRLEKIAFTIRAISQGMSPDEAGAAFAKIKQAQKDAPFNREADSISADAQKALTDQKKFFAQQSVIDRAEQQASGFIFGQMGEGMDRRQATDLFVKTFQEAAERSGKEIPEFLKQWLDDFKQRQFASVDQAEQKQQSIAEREAGKVLAGVVRQGLAGLESGLMSLGGPKQEDFTSKVGRLEANSQETFDVMRANVGREKKDDVPAKQLKVAEKQEKLLDKIAKAVSDKPPKGYVKVLGLD